jgi:hypothetical protein
LPRAIDDSHIWSRHCAGILPNRLDQISVDQDVRRRQDGTGCVHGKDLSIFDEYLHFYNRYPVRHRSDRTRNGAEALPHAYPTAKALLRLSADGRKTVPPITPKPVSFITITNFADGHANPDNPRRSCAVRNGSNSRAKPVIRHFDNAFRRETNADRQLR